MLVFNELRYAYRQPLVLIASIAALLISIVIGMGSLNDKTSVNELHQVYAILQMLIMPAVFTVITVATLLRDKNSNMMELIDSTPMTFRKRWLLRVLTTTAMVSFPFIVGFGAISGIFAAEQGDGLQAMMVFFAVSVGGIVPNTLLLASLVLLILKYSDSSFTIYAFSAGFGIVYILVGSLLGFPFLSGSSVVSDGFYDVMLWLDPFGITPLLHNTETNSLNSAELIVNRVLNLAVCCALLVFLTSGNKNSSYSKQAKTVFKERLSSKVSLSRYLNAMSPRTVVSRLLLANMKVLASSKITQVLFALWAFIVLNEVLSTLLIGGVDQTTDSNANSIMALNAVALDVYLVFTSVCIALWSWQICWENKRLDFDGIIASMPISNIQKIVAEIVSLSILLGLLTIIMGLASLVAELIAGSDVIFSHYFLQLSLSYLPQVLLSIIFVCLHHMLKSPAKAGLVIFMILLVKFTPVTSSVGVTNLLWNVAGSPIQPANQYWLFLDSLHVYLPFTLFWILFAITLFFIAVSVSHRGTGYVMAKSKLNNAAKVMLFLTVGVGVVIDYQLTTEKPLTYSLQKESWKKGYEESFRHYSTLPQPKIVEITSNAELYPESGLAQFTVHYRLTNMSDEIIPKILVGRHGNLDDWSLELPTSGTKHSKLKFNHSEVLLSEPMRPGKSIKLSARFTVQQPLLWPYNENMILSEQYTRIAADYLLPVVGYQASFEIKDRQRRIALGLIEQPTPPSLPVKALVKSKVSTHSNHTVVPIGELVEDWAQGDRRFYQFASTKPIYVDFSWLSMPVKPIRAGGQGLKVLFFTPSQNIVPNSIIKSAVFDFIRWTEASIPSFNLSNINVVYTPLLESDIQPHAQTVFLNSNWVFTLATTSREEFNAEQYGKMTRAAIMSMLIPYDSNTHMKKLIASIIQLKIMKENLGEIKTDEFLLRVSSEHEKLYNLSEKQNATELVVSSFLDNLSLTLASELLTTMPDDYLKTAITRYLDTGVNLFGSNEFVSNEELEFESEQREEVNNTLRSYFSSDYRNNL
ncbi:hypothetical protein RI845_11720 [Thalassotalea nanhaiensis]|uniref:Uncharacterized protein n=1 Tax=Thalassotalea nanhaiensis TaxID=3065648 RepID=A0ABY9TEF4_9GAMM|nr:hypothetical protein RI845_11720 [Colwelliaceae bacterium SQ345]